MGQYLYVLEVFATQLHNNQNVK